MPAVTAPHAATLRLDRLLWFLRLSKSRTSAQALCAAGHVRVNGHRVDRAHYAVRAGDIVTLPWGQGARVFRMIALPVRRGPAPEAAACYEELITG